MKIPSTMLLGAVCATMLVPAASADARHVLPRHHARHFARSHAPTYAGGHAPRGYGHAPRGFGYAPRGYGYAYPGYGYDGGYGYRGPTSATADATLNGNSFNAGAAQLPPPGTYNGYQGPGATVLRRSLEAQFEPGVTGELFPGAKQTATGGPAGGIPGAGGGR